MKIRNENEVREALARMFRYAEKAWEEGNEVCRILGIERHDDVYEVLFRIQELYLTDVDEAVEELKASLE